ncbi:phage baseplate assembly protein [Cupriavidus sp. D39]|uniref:phage baseplate assembly protein n=1 Tax=Cupriavidus sp. D39 TaxID=2997877 RepID=UPI002D1E3C45|nr:hypothetical protein [Cupriavidus sp. D39]
MLSGWTRLRVTSGIERFPSDFELGMTELYPGQASDVVVQPGDTCKLMVGDTPIVTGYVDRVGSSISPNTHEIRVTGRGSARIFLIAPRSGRPGKSQIARCTT